MMPDARPLHSVNTRRTTRRLAAFALAPLACLLVAPPAARGQVVIAVEEEDASPPPLRYVTPAERLLLDDARDLKSRTRVCLELAESRLSRATQLAAAGRFEAATAELGIYQALVAEAVGRLRADGRARDDQTLDLLKRVELTLRAHAPRVEQVRRMTPSEYAAHVRAAYDFVRQARADALEAFFGNTVAPTDEAIARQRAEAAARRPESFARLERALDLLSDSRRAAEAVPILVELLKDEEAFVRSNAAGGLGIVGAEAQPAVPALVRLLRDKNALVRYSAAEAIHRIGTATRPAHDRASQTNR